MQNYNNLSQNYNNSFKHLKSSVEKIKDKKYNISKVNQTKKGNS